MRSKNGADFDSKRQDCILAQENLRGTDNAEKFSALGSFAALMASPCLAGASENRAIDETADQITQAIHSGDTDLQRELLPALTETEFTELGKLAGCAARSRAEEDALAVYVDWSCDQGASMPGLNRGTGMFFAASGELIGFSVNRAAQAFAPTQIAIAADIPSARALLGDFGRAIVDGGDATLGGMVALNEFDVARLAPYAGGEFMVANWQIDGQYVIYLSNPAQTDRRLAAALQIDEAGRPTGLAVLPTYDRSNAGSLHARRREPRRPTSTRRDLSGMLLTTPRSELARDPSRAICKAC